MNRRNFFKVSSLAIGAATLTNIAGGAISKVFAAGKRNASSNDFSLELVTGTGDEDKAIKLAEEIIKSLRCGSGIINFSEYRIDKAESADIVLVQNSSVINYKNGSGDIQKGIREIANELKLPRIITNPVRLKFSSSGSGDAAGNFLIFHKESVVEKISADSSNRNISVAGSRGEVIININSKKARVVQSSCEHKNCINSGSISLSGENIVCIPNEVHVIAE